MWSTILSSRQKKSRRAPAAEFFAHVAGARKLYRSLLLPCRIQEFFDLAQDHFARGIARRLKEMGQLPRHHRETVVAFEIVARSRLQGTGSRHGRPLS